MLFPAATAEAQNLRFNETTKRGLKSQCIIGELRSLSSVTVEKVVTRCFVMKPKVNRLRQKASEQNIEAKAYYFSATAGAQANKLPTKTLENAFKVMISLNKWWIQALEKIFLKNH